MFGDVVSNGGDFNKVVGDVVWGDMFLVDWDIEGY